MRTRIRLFFVHRMAPALLRTLGFEWQVINFLLRKAISFFTVHPIISGQLFHKASPFLTRLRRHLAIEQLVKRLQFNICQRFAFSCSSRVIQNNRAWPMTQALSSSILYRMYWRSRNSNRMGRMLLHKSVDSKYLLCKTSRSPWTHSILLILHWMLR